MIKRNNRIVCCFFVICFLSISGCRQQSPDNNDQISIRIIADNTWYAFTLLPGNSVQEILEIANLSLGPSDIVAPPVNSRLLENTTITITRVKETIETQREVIPFERKEFPNESMAVGEIRLLQAGKNGLLERSIIHVYHDEIEISHSLVSEILLAPPEPEIIMVGVPSPFNKFSIDGTIIYLNSGNAWVIESSTANRRPLVTTGDIDGRIFTLSPDGRWLLFSRKSSKPISEEINTLWVVDVTDLSPELIDIHVSNVIHFADWQPGFSYQIAFSTVEPRSTAPGWQANNDLFMLTFDPEKKESGIPELYIPSSSGGIYGWWGTTFEWSPDGTQLAFSSPDSIGLVDFSNQSYITLIPITPLKTFSDWAWLPEISWSGDQDTLFFVNHSPPASLISPEESPFFDLVAYSFSTRKTSTLRSQVGMFAYPISSPSRELDGELIYQVTCLQSIFPTQSETSRYRQIIMDHDGSDQVQLFPDEALTGIHAQSRWGAWSPEHSSTLFALIYEGNIWIIDTLSGAFQQVTGDGLTARLDWK